MERFNYILLNTDLDLLKFMDEHSTLTARFEMLGLQYYLPSCLSYSLNI